MNIESSIKNETNTGIIKRKHKNLQTQRTIHNTQYGIQNTQQTLHKTTAKNTQNRTPYSEHRIQNTEY